jgi:hypothetical protein
MTTKEKTREGHHTRNTVSASSALKGKTVRNDVSEYANLSASAQVLIKTVIPMFHKSPQEQRRGSRYLVLISHARKVGESREDLPTADGCGNCQLR